MDISLIKIATEELYKELLFLIYSFRGYLHHSAFGMGFDCVYTNAL